MPSLLISVSYRIGYGESGVGQDLGYCPQDEALDRYLSGEETLHFYARMRGLPDSYRKYVSYPSLCLCQWLAHYFTEKY